MPGLEQIAGRERFDGDDFAVLAGQDFLQRGGAGVLAVVVGSRTHSPDRHIPGPQGVRGRNSNNDLIREKLGWAPKQDLYGDITKTYRWIEQQVKDSK